MKILVIDSETSACDLLVRSLQSYFPEHEWQTAASYEEGLALAQQTTELDLVFADLKTNEAGGPSVANLIQGMFPRVQTYYLGNQGQETTMFRARAGRVFSKPVNVREVVAAIQLAEESIALNASKEFQGAEPDKDGRKGLEKLNRMIAREGFTGHLAQFQLHEIIQMCCLGQRTGSMTVSKGSENGVIFFYDGQVVHAQCGEFEGEPAVDRIVGWKSGQFTFADGIIADRTTIETDWSFLLLESMRKLDEQAAAGLMQVAEIQSGHCLGPYHLTRKIGETPHEETYVANLHSTGLELTLCLLPKSRRADPGAVKQFVAEATTKSELDHPAFLRATKAVQTEGIYYYTLERIDAMRLKDFAGHAHQLSEPLALETLRVVGQAMSELTSNHQSHNPLTAADVLIDSKGGVRLANLASFRPAATVSIPRQIGSLARAIRAAIAPAGIRSGGLKSVLRRMEGTGPDRIHTWQGLRKAADSVSLNAVVASSEQDEGSEEHTGFVVNLVPDEPSFDSFKLGIAAALAGLLIGSVFWITVRPDRAHARNGSLVGSLMAAEIDNAPLIESMRRTVDTNESPRIYASVSDLTGVQRPAAGLTAGDSESQRATDAVATWTVDLSRFVNCPLDQPLHSQEGPSLAGLESGVRVLDAVPFNIGGVVQLSGGGFTADAPRTYPGKLTGIPVNRRVRALHFLQGSGFNQPTDQEIGRYVVHYRDGSSTTIPILNNVHVRDWWHESADLSPAWEGVIGLVQGEQKTGRLYHQTWNNPRPDQEIASVDFSSTMTAAAPFLVAMTAE